MVDRAPTNDYALFCLGRSLQMLGRHAEARQPLALAACMQPERSDYRAYRDRARDAAERAATRSNTPTRAPPAAESGPRSRTPVLR